MLQDVLIQLEKVINSKMREFGILLRCTRELNKYDVPEKVLTQIYKDMGEILIELEPVKEIVYRNNPKLITLFEKLQEFTKTDKSESKE